MAITIPWHRYSLPKAYIEANGTVYSDKLVYLPKASGFGYLCKSDNKVLEFTGYQVMAEVLKTAIINLKYIPGISYDERLVVMNRLTTICHDIVAGRF